MIAWFKRNWLTLMSAGCTVVASGALPVNPLITVAVGTICTAVASRYAKPIKPNSGVIVQKE